MSARLYVGNLPYSCTDDDVRELFKTVNIEPTSVRVIMDRGTGLSKGFGFVELETHELAVMSRNKLTGASIGNRNLVIDLAKPNPTGRK
ncbi:MAG: RNA-binding protein [Deltaproteobacteria bacterium]|nr:RNA-binding protein [Deltaproteobacteria bacterium]